MIINDGICARKAYLVFTGGGPLVILTTYDSIVDPDLINKLAEKGVDKFIAHEINIEMAQKAYGGQFDSVCRDLNQTNDLRVLDYNGHRAFALFRFEELGPTIFKE